MARRSRSRNRSRSRVASVNAPRSWAIEQPVRLAPIAPRRVSRRPAAQALSLIEDRRRWHPNRFPDPVVRVGRSSSSARPRLVQHSTRYGRLMRVGFKSPAHVVVCIRRALRRRVMFAHGGAGSRKMRRPRRGPFSNVRC